MPNSLPRASQSGRMWLVNRKSLVAVDNLGKPGPIDGHDSALCGGETLVDFPSRSDVGGQLPFEFFHGTEGVNVA